MREFINIVTEGIREGDQPYDYIYWFWYHPGRGVIEHVDQGTHTTHAFYEMGYTRPLHPHEHEDGLDMSDDTILARVLQDGWVRGRYGSPGHGHEGKTWHAAEERTPNAELSLQGQSLRDLQKTAIMVAGKWPVAALYLDQGLTHDMESTVLKGGRLEFFLKRGTIPTQMVQEGRNDLYPGAKPKLVAHLTDEQKYKLANYIYKWLNGSFMNGKGDWNDHIREWKMIRDLFPPKIKQPVVSLYRLVTLPISHADKSEITINPGHGPLTSWAQKLTGIDSVMGIASEFGHSDYTCRVAIQADIPASSIWATPVSMRDCFMSLTHGYFERFPETTKIVRKKDSTGQMLDYHETTHPGWPGGDSELESYEKDGWSISDVGFLQDVMNRPGGHYKQYECIVHTPKPIRAKIVRVYRKGNRILRYGNEDPHN